MNKVNLLLFTLIFSLNSAAQSVWKNAQKPRLVTDSANYGDFYYLKSKGKGLVLCLHGSGGSGKNWATKTENSKFLNNLKEAGYGFLCPSALGKQWISRGGTSSKDLKRVDALLSALGEKTGDLYLVGHSNGGGFASFFTVFSSFKSRIKGAQYTNSSGIGQVIKHASYSLPTLFVGATCDKVASFSDAKKNYLSLQRKGIKTKIKDLQYNYQVAKSKTCHEFVDSSSFFLNFFTALVKNGDQLDLPSSSSSNDRR